MAVLRAPRTLVGLAVAGLVSTTLVVAAPILTATAQAATQAAFTTVDESVDGSGHCKNGNPAVNCNIYDGKQYVYMNGGPSAAALGDGSYFFAVLSPGGQADPNDGTANNLSSPNDDWTNRQFSVSNGVLTYTGTHFFDSVNNEIRLMPYDDTTNPGGVYVMAICAVPGTIATTNAPGVTPSACKYDNFKVQVPSTCTPDGSPECPFPPASEPTVSKDAAGAYNDTFTWGITKDVDKTSVTTADGSATFHYTVTVTHDSGTISGVTVTGTIDVTDPNVDSSFNTVPVTLTGVSDQLSDGTTCTVDTSGGLTLSSFDNLFPYTCALSSLPQGELDNTATATWDAQTLSNSTQLAGGSAPFTFSNITFTGTKIDDCVTVTDTVEGTLGNVCSTDKSPTAFTYGVTVNGTPGTCVTQPNTATFTTDTSGTTGDASQSVTECTPEDLTVTKTANPSFTRTYSWSITKLVDKTKVETSGSTATFNYTVGVSQTGVSDSAIEATGSITVHNPNDFEAITLTGVTDAVDNGGTCKLTGGSSTATIAASQSTTLTYECDYTSVPANGTNTATATWDPTAALTPDGSASGTAAVSFGAPTSTVNKTITPTDAFNGGSGVNLCSLTSTPTQYCTLTGTDSSPFTSHSYAYSRSIPVTPNACNSFSNTAATGTGPTSGQTVTTCGAVTGGLTMGFWQNKNGQGIITGGASTSGVCNSGTWLRTYAPFQDLSATATCSQVASYVSGVIKAASAGGTSMNPMLKAQMLATALDVYFSTPSLGGNKINAPTPLGGVVVDLTTICKMIDSSSGGTCSGTTENASSAFGGATSLTISQMLTYAAGQSNVGGSTWYGQVKSVQGLAKDAFDAINNGVAFA